MSVPQFSAEAIRASRDRDFADSLGISEGALVAAYCGHGVTRIDAHPDVIMDAAQQLGEVMALTRNASCVHEKIGTYDNYHPGHHAAMILTEDIDLRIFPSHWQHAFLVERECDTGTRRSLQVFDAAGDAVHKIILRDGSNHAAFADLITKLASDNQSPNVTFAQRQPPEAPKIAVDMIDILRKEWKRTETEVMLFVGNRGCIQIHTGALHNLKPMGPWQNVIDPRFNLHLRCDHVAEVWAVDKPTQRGAATSVEAFDADGALIFQVFGIPKEGRDSRPAFRAIVAQLDGVAA